MSGPQTSYSPQVERFYSLAEAYKRKDVNFIAKHLHKDFRRIGYPRSLGKSEQNADEWLKETAEMMNIWTGDSKASHASSYSNSLPSTEPLPQVDIHSLTETPEKVVIHVRPENVWINATCA